jgi:hypothetical protein
MKSGVEAGEVDLVDIDENDPPADSASEPPAPSIGSGASAPASTASCGNLFAFGVVSTAPAAPAAQATGSAHKAGAGVRAGHTAGAGAGGPNAGVRAAGAATNGVAQKMVAGEAGAMPKAGTGSWAPPKNAAAGAALRSPTPLAGERAGKGATDGAVVAVLSPIAGATPKAGAAGAAAPKASAVASPGTPKLKLPAAAAGAACASRNGEAAGGPAPAPEPKEKLPVAGGAAAAAQKAAASGREATGAAGAPAPTLNLSGVPAAIVGGGAAAAPAAAEMRVQGTLSRVDAYGLCCLAWNAAAKEVPLSINLEGVQASPETLAVACWALCPSVTSLSFKGTRLTADGANTVALERLCGLLRGGHAANGALTALDLSRNHLKDEGVSAVCKAIQSNKETKLSSLNFEDNGIGPVGANAVAAMVAVTGGLTWVRCTPAHDCGLF